MWGSRGEKRLKKGALLRAVTGGQAGPDEVVLWKRLQGFWLCVAYLLPGSWWTVVKSCTQYINTPRYISRQSLSICCLLKASTVLKAQSPSGSFQVSSSRTSCAVPDMDLRSASHEGRVPGPLYCCGLHTQPSMSQAALRPAHCKKSPQSDPVENYTESWQHIPLKPKPNFCQWSEAAPVRSSAGSFVTGLCWV